MFFCVVLFFCDVFVYYFIKISKFALPGVMLMYERTSNERKERKPSLKAHIDVSSGARSIFWSESSATSILCVCEQLKALVRLHI